jgi:hypothetical protein
MDVKIADSGGRLLAGIVGFNPAGGMDVLCWVVSKDKRQNVRQSRQRHKYG